MSRRICLLALAVWGGCGGLSGRLVGNEAGDDAPGASAVGAIVFTNDGRRPESSATVNVHCTAFALTSDLILTAAHCLSTRTCGDRPNATFPASTAMYFVQGRDARYAGWSRRIDRSFCHQEYQPSTCDADLAIAHLDEPLPDGAWLRPEIVPADGRPLIKLGYGIFMRTSGEDSFHPAAKRGIAEPLTVLHPSDLARQYRYVGHAANGRSLEICRGDSGGPGFQLRSNAVELVGVTSMMEAERPDEACGKTGHDTHLEPFEPWIDSIIATPAAGSACL